MFHAERDISAGEEIFNCYGMQGNIQWLLNGGFRDSSRPCDDLLVTPADVVSSALAHMHFCKDETDAAEDEEDFLCARLSLLQDCGIGRGSFCISPTDILPDDLATMLLVMCMTDAEFATYRQQRAGGADPVIDLGGTEGEELPETLLAKLYGCLLRLAQLLEQKYDTSLEEDQDMLLSLEEAQEAQEPSTKRLCRSQVLPRVPDGVRPDNARNILCLRIGQKQLLRQLAEQADRKSVV